MLAFTFMESKMYRYTCNAGHMTKFAAIPVYGKIPLKILFHGTKGTITRERFVASGTPAHHSSSYDSRLTLTYFV